MASHSPFTISPQQASHLVRLSCHGDGSDVMDDNRQCYLLQLSFQPVYGGGPLPQSCFKKIPRLINGIPLGAGRLSHNQAQGIVWRYIEGSQPRDLHTFISAPVSKGEADEARRSLREGLVRHAKAVFGDITVKTTMILCQCVHFDSELFINDLAEPLEEGLHFKD